MDLKIWTDKSSFFFRRWATVQFALYSFLAHPSCSWLVRKQIEHFISNLFKLFNTLACRVLKQNPHFGVSLVSEESAMFLITFKFDHKSFQNLSHTDLSVRECCVLNNKPIQYFTASSNENLLDLSLIKFSNSTTFSTFNYFVIAKGPAQWSRILLNRDQIWARILRSQQQTNPI